MWVKYRTATLRLPGSAPLSCACRGLQLCSTHCGGAKKGGERDVAAPHRSRGYLWRMPATLGTRETDKGTESIDIQVWCIYHAVLSKQD